MEYTGGLTYRYPWVEYSRTLVNKSGELHTEENSRKEKSSTFDKKKEYKVYNATHDVVLAQGKIGASDEIETLVPDTEHTILDVDGKLFK